MLSFTRLLSIAGASLIASAASAIINGVEPDPGDTRFDAVAAFGLTDSLNGTLEEHNHFCNGTLITPTKMIMARHCLEYIYPDNQPPSGTYTFRFRRNPDGSLGTKAQGWESFHQVEVTHFTFHGEGLADPDILIAHLAEPVTHIEPIAIARPGFLRAGMEVITAAWGTEANGARGRLTMHTNVQTVQDADSPTGMNDCSAVNLFQTNGDTANYDSGGAFLVMTTRIPVPYDYIQRDPQDDPIAGGVRGGVGSAGGGGIAPQPVQPKPVLVGVIKSVGNHGHRAFWHEALEPCIAYDCFRRPRVEDNCFLLMDLDGDFIVTEDDLDLALAMYVGPCAGGPFPSLCVRVDDPTGDYGNGDGFMDGAELTAFFYGEHFGAYCDCLEDVTQDGVVDTSDVMQVMGAFGPCDCSDACVEDVNQDRVVDQADLDLVLMNIGQCDH